MRLLDQEIQEHGEDAEQKPRFLRLLRIYWIELIKLNLLFVLFSLPILTVPAAVTAMTRIVMEMLYQKPFDYSMKQDFFNTFRKEFLRSLCVGLPVMLVLALCLYGIITAGWNGEQTRLGLAAVSFFVLFSCLNAAMYLFPQLAYLDLSVGQALRNTLILLFAEFKKNLICDVFLAAAILVMVATFPFLAPLFLFCYFSYPCFLICFCLRPALDRCIRQPQAAADDVEI